jgi:hypothetical protein
MKMSTATLWVNILHNLFGYIGRCDRAFTAVQLYQEKQKS